MNINLKTEYGDNHKSKILKPKFFIGQNFMPSKEEELYIKHNDPSKELRTWLKPGTNIHITGKFYIWMDSWKCGLKFEPVEIKVLPITNPSKPILKQDYSKMLTSLQKGDLSKLHKSISKRLASFRPNDQYEITITDLDVILNRTGGVLTGSFLLSALLKEDFQGCDLDIFISSEIDPRYTCYRLWGLLPIPDPKFSKSIKEYLQEDLLKSFDGPRLSLITNVINYPNGIQFIQVDLQNSKLDVQAKPEDLEQYVKDWFDLTFCTATLSHKRFSEPVDGLESLFSRKGRVLSPFGLLDSIKQGDRSQKYAIRGFAIEPRLLITCSKCGVSNKSSKKFIRHYCGHFTHFKCPKDRGLPVNSSTPSTTYTKSINYTLEHCQECLKKFNQPLLNLSEECIDQYRQLWSESFREYCEKTRPNLEIISSSFFSQHLMATQARFTKYQMYFGHKFRCLGIQCLKQFKEDFTKISKQHLEQTHERYDKQVWQLREKIKELEEQRYAELEQFQGVVCPICRERIGEKINCGQCRISICQECQVKLNRCPYCRQNYLDSPPKQDDSAEDIAPLSDTDSD